MKPRILIIEDNPTEQAIVKSHFTLLGCEILSANNGEEGLKLIQKDKNFSAIILDLVMPVMDGATFYKALRNDPAVNKIPIIPFSAITNQENSGVTGEIALNWISNALEGKPITTDKLTAPIVKKGSGNPEQKPYLKLILDVARYMEKDGVELPEEYKKAKKTILETLFPRSQGDL